MQGGQDSVSGGHFLLSPALYTLQMGFKPSQSPWSGERSLSQCTVCCQPDWAIKTWGRLPHRFCDISTTVRPDCNPHQPPAKCHHPGRDEAAPAPQGKHKSRGHRRSVGSGSQPEVLGPDTRTGSYLCKDQDPQMLPVSRIYKELLQTQQKDKPPN